MYTCELVELQRFLLDFKGQPLTTYILTMGNTNVLNGAAGFAVMQPFDFTFRGDVTNYQLANIGRKM
jgi:hypothetical protein